MSTPRTPYSWPAESIPTDEQVAEWLAVCTPAERLERVTWWREQATRAQRCWIESHEPRLERLAAPGPGRHRAEPV